MKKFEKHSEINQVALKITTGIKIEEAELSVEYIGIKYNLLEIVFFTLIFINSMNYLSDRILSLGKVKLPLLFYTPALFFVVLIIGYLYLLINTWKKRKELENFKKL